MTKSPSADADPAQPHEEESVTTHLRTAWHPLLIMLLEALLPAGLWRVAAEFMLTREPRRIDAVIVRRVADASAWHADYLRSVLDDLREHNIVHFKGATDELERVDALQLLSYAYQYMALEGLEATAALSLRVVAPTLTPRFYAQVTTLGGALAEATMRGVHDGTLGGFTLRVVETSVVWPHPGEHLLYAVSPACVEAPGRIQTFDDREKELYYRLLQGIARLANNPNWKVIMKDATLVESAASKALQDLLDALPPEVRFAGLKPEDRLAGLKPEDRLAGLKPEDRLAGLSAGEQILALSDDVLRGLPDAYVATLPADVQATIHARLAR